MKEFQHSNATMHFACSELDFASACLHMGKLQYGKHCLQKKKKKRKDMKDTRFPGFASLQKLGAVYRVQTMPYVRVLSFFVCFSCACLMRPPSLGTKPYQAHYLSVCCVLRAHVQFCRFDKADTTAGVQ